MSHDFISECPHCKANLVGEEILEAARENYGGHSHFSRLVGIYDRDRDRTSHFVCPDCGKRIEHSEAWK